MQVPFGLVLSLSVSPDPSLSLSVMVAPSASELLSACRSLSRSLSLAVDRPLPIPPSLPPSLPPYLPLALRSVRPGYAVSAEGGGAETHQLLPARVYEERREEGREGWWDI